MWMERRADKYVPATDWKKKRFSWCPPWVGALILVLLAYIIVAAILTKLTSAGPVFFAQKRLGRGKRIFSMYKFRSMVPDAEQRQAELEHLNEARGPVFKIQCDPRITPLGRYLRRSSIDELPQLWNVLRGQMSLVGPRPDLVEQAAHYSESDRRRLSVEPGITGWSQVNGRESIGWPERIEQDLWYIDHWSPALDLKILWRTFRELGRSAEKPVVDTMNIERARARK